MSGPKIDLADVAKAFGARDILDGVNLSIEPGESMAIIGQSGSGKSVTLKCILGLVRPDRGSIRVDGAEVVGASGRDLERTRAQFGLLVQGRPLFHSPPVWPTVPSGPTRGPTRGASATPTITHAHL